MFRQALFVPVHTRMYQCCTSTYSHRSLSHFISRAIQAPSRLRPSRVSFLRLSDDLLAESCLSAVSSIVDQAANVWLATSKLPQPSVNLIDVTASPSILCSCICTSCRETCTLVPAVLVRDSWCRIAIQKQGHQGDSAHHVLGLGHVETRCRGWFVQLNHPSIFHRSTKVLKKTRLYLRSSGPVL